MLIAHKLKLEYGVLVTTKDKKVLKEFATKPEADSFAEQFKKFPDVKTEVIQRKLFGKEGRPTSIAFQKQILKGGTIDYKVVRVPPKRGMMFCTECHEYVKFKVTERLHGSTANCCPQCGISDNDCYIKTANGLWPTFKK